MVEHLHAREKVTGSIPVFRFTYIPIDSTGAVSRAGRYAHCNMKRNEHVYYTWDIINKRAISLEEM